MLRIPDSRADDSTREDCDNCRLQQVDTVLSECSSRTATSPIKRPAFQPEVRQATKRPRLASDCSRTSDCSSSAECMSDRANCHTSASSTSSCSSSQSRPAVTRSQLSNWHTLPTPVPATLEELARLQLSTRGHTHARWDLLSSLEFSPDGSQLATAGVGKQVRVYTHLCRGIDSFILTMED